MVATLRLSLLLTLAGSQPWLEGLAATPGEGSKVAVDFFVSPRGKDTWSGKPAAPGENTKGQTNNRMFVCTDILAFEGDGRRLHSAGDYDYYVEKKQRAAAAARESAGEWTAKPSATRSPDGAAKSARPRKLTFKETRELAGMEATILAAEKNIARIEALFAEPDFHRQHGQRTPELTAELAAAKERLARLYERWQELEAIRTGSAS